MPIVWRRALSPNERSEAHRSRSRDALCVNAHGFGLHAGVRCEANDRPGIEQLCRYITRPAISNERLSVNRDGNVVLKLKTAYRNGATHIVWTPMEFMQRLALQKATAGNGDCQHAHGAPLRMRWTRLLKRVFDIDIERCACGGQRKLIAGIEVPEIPSTSSGQGSRSYWRIAG